MDFLREDNCVIVSANLVNITHSSMVRLYAYRNKYPTSEDEYKCNTVV